MAISVFITDNNIITNDSDSETSSTSTVEELKASNDKNISNIKSKLMDSFVKPIQSHMYLNKEKALEIEDGFELSLLRLVHIWFSTDGVINFDRLTKYIDKSKKESQELEDLFLDNPGVMLDSDFYSSGTGVKIRNTWYEFLSNRAFFTYVHKSHQLVPDNANFFQFIKYFFPLVKFYENSNNEQEKLNIIYNGFSTEVNKFHVIYSTYAKVDEEFAHKGFVHNIYVNETPLFIFESSNIKQSINLEKIYWTKTELRYA